MDRQISHKKMRVMIGVIAFLLAPITCWLADADTHLDSISQAYWTSSGDIFVGSLIVVGFFMFVYNGTSGGRDSEYYLSKLSCVLATLTALFPTTGFADSHVPPTWTSAVSKPFGLDPSDIHNISASLLFLCLILMIWCFSGSAKKKGEPTRCYIYRCIGTLMFVGVVSIGIYGKRAHLDNTMLLVEVWVLMLFGSGWFIAGTYKPPINP